MGLVFPDLANASLRLGPLADSSGPQLDLPARVRRRARPRSSGASSGSTDQREFVRTRALRTLML
ncbi:Hypothetical protein I596_865 [Dokdonella koreensis DS-123]|uniref:Uncharacterized protein n=1 Tax=Dokdonella koreensis DS-123 TaxID=1300342 RepID=A0A167GNX6_9GAMM|nr:Hypothetical protein I596_865 [Dokdonella koreensis DS-123]